MLVDLSRTRAIVDAAVDGIITINARGNIETFNGAAQKIFGYGAGEVIGQNVSVLMPAPYRENHDHYLKNYLTTHEKKIIGIGREVQGLRKDGTIFPMDLAVNEYYDGDDQYFVGIIRDISERKQVEEKIATRTLQLAALNRLGEELMGNMAPETIMDEAIHAMIGTMNAEYFTIMEYVPGEEILLVRKYSGLDQQAWENAALPLADDPFFARTLRTDKPLVVTHLTRNAHFSDNPSLPGPAWTSGISSIIGNVGDPFGILCVFSDRECTYSDDDIGFIQSLANLLGMAIDRRRTEIQMHDLQNQMLSVSRLSAMGELGSALAHELNQPITALMNYLQAWRLLLEKNRITMPDDILTLGDKAVNEADRIAAIIKHLRDYVESGVMHRNIEDLNGVIKNACELALPEAGEKGVKVEYDLHPALPTMAIDKIQIQQVVFNLLHNSMEAMERSVKREVTIRTTPHGDAVEILIQDTGPGMPPDIFERQFKTMFSQKKQGMGIGLSICKSIIEAHDGRIWATTTPGGGATIHFTLPVTNGERNNGK